MRRKTGNDCKVIYYNTGTPRLFVTSYATENPHKKP